MRTLPFILSLLTATALHAEDFTQTAQFRLGRLLATDSVNFVIEYPEYRALSTSEIEELQQSGFTPSQQVVFHSQSSLSRGETLVDVSFIPVIERNGQWLLAQNYNLKPIITGPHFSPAARASIQAAKVAEQSSRYAAHSVLAQGKWVKIAVKEEGIYQLSDAELKKAGFSDPSRVRLYGYGGRLLPETFTFTGSDALIDDLNEVPLYRRDGSVLFFAEGLTTWKSNTQFQTNTFSNYSYYFLTESDSPAAQFEQSTQTTTNAPTTITTITAHALLDNDAVVWYQGGRNFYDDNELQTGHTFRLSLPGSTGENCQLSYDVAAQTSSSSSSFTIYNAASGSVLVNRSLSKTSDGEDARGYRGTITGNFGSEARLEIETATSGKLNYLYASYKQQLSTLYTQSAFSPSVSGAVQLNVANADANTRVWQLGDAQSVVKQLPGTLDGDVYKATTTDGNKRFFIVNVAKTYPSPTIIGDVANQDLHADAAIDYVIIVPASGKLTERAEQLAQAHASLNGLRTKVVRADQIYNEFSSGTPDATAYRRYLKMLYDKAASDADAPRYLLLFGNCAFDNRMITSDWKKADPNDYLLAYERSDEEGYNTSYRLGTLHDYVTDDYYGLLDDNEGSRITSEKIDLGIGRFLCTTDDEAKTLVDNTTAYMNNIHAGAWKNRMWAIGDVGDNNLHMNDAQAVCTQVSQSAPEGLMLRRIYPDAYTATEEARGTTYPEATASIKRAMQQGALIFNYNGHGSPSRLSHSFLLDESDIKSNVSTALPVWVYASCEITPYDQSMTDMGRSALYNEQGAAVAVVCASRSVYANLNRSFNKGFVKYVFAKRADNTRYTLGDAIRLTKAELVTYNQYGQPATNTIGNDGTINKMKYALLGDPALTLGYADPGVVIDSINGQPIGESLASIQAGQSVRFSGHVNADTSGNTADESFDGTLYGTLYAPVQTITCKGYGSNSRLTYTDYTQSIFEGSVNIVKGKFSFETYIPRGTKLQQNASLLSLYALSQDKKKEYNGRFNRFCINQSSTSEEVDTLGPKVYLYLNTPDFVDGGAVGTSPKLYASISDSTAISMASGNMGHDMELWLDGQTTSPIIVNDYFSFESGSYKQGLLEYPLSDLSQGKHSVTFRVWDVFDNSSISTLQFVVRNEGTPSFDVNSTEATPHATTRFITSFASLATESAPTTVETEVYSISGMRVWNQSSSIPAGSTFAAFDWDLCTYSGQRLPTGVYLYRSKVNNKYTDTKKLIIR